jgi:hypothetical protein
MIFYYLLPAALTLGIVLEAFFRDLDGAKSDRQSWLLISLIVLLWPITLPSMLLHKYRQRQSQVQPLAEQSAELYAYEFRS